MTELTHQDGSYVQSSYNSDGTLASVTDELGHTTSYTYDEYKRVLTVTKPFNQTATNSYAPRSGTGSLSHTTASVYRSTSPMGKMTDFTHDENFRRFVVHEGVGTPADDATTVSGFDAVGNMTWDARPAQLCHLLRLRQSQPADLNHGRAGPRHQHRLRSGGK